MQHIKIIPFVMMALFATSCINRESESEAELHEEYKELKQEYQREKAAFQR